MIVFSAAVVKLPGNDNPSPVIIFLPLLLALTSLLRGTERLLWLSNGRARLKILLSRAVSALIGDLIALGALLFLLSATSLEQSFYAWLVWTSVGIVGIGMISATIPVRASLTLAPAAAVISISWLGTDLEPLAIWGKESIAIMLFIIGFSASVLLPRIRIARR